MTDAGPTSHWLTPDGGQICTQGAMNQQGVSTRKLLWEGPQGRIRGTNACSYFFPEPCGGGKCDLVQDYPYGDGKEPKHCRMVYGHSGPDGEWESRLKCHLKSQYKGEDIETFKEELRNSEEFIADGGRTGHLKANQVVEDLECQLTLLMMEIQVE